MNSKFNLKPHALQELVAKEIREMAFMPWLTSELLIHDDGINQVIIKITKDEDEQMGEIDSDYESHDGGAIDSSAQFLDYCEELISQYPFLYVEVARTRITGWMAHVHTHNDKDHADWKSLAIGQSESYSGACAAALEQLKVGE